MALSATICRVALNLADVDRHRYADVALTVARHPSENDERMMQRVLCYALYAHEELSFTKGLSSDDEPDLWQKDLTGEIEHWIDLGQPDLRRIAKACGRARRVSVHCYSGHGAEIWFDKLGSALGRFDNLRIVHVSPDSSAALAALAGRNMALQVYIEDQQVLVSDDQHNVTIVPQVWFPETA
ncbi:MAG: YaeQ family protein [Gammaproteobacteria bacterium]